MPKSSRPVIILGEGARGADLSLLPPIPILSSWQAKDLYDNFAPNYFGSPGQYGQRVANMVLHHADYVIALGNRLSIWNAGYEGLRPDQRLLMVDVDAMEVERFPHADWMHSTVAKAMPDFASMECSGEWLSRCEDWRFKYPLVESPTHDDKDGYINSYRFFSALQWHLKPDSVIVTDAGSACASAWQTIKVKPPQRMLSSGGLGEMGCGLPLAIGASFARNKGEVICIVGDGAMMMNLQEMATIAHHKLPIKIIVCSNDGYMMIRHTQTQAKMAYAGVNKATGITLPSFRALAHSWGLAACDVNSWEDFNKAIPQMMAVNEPCLIEYRMHPEQVIAPKLNPVFVDGVPTSPAFCDMSPKL